MRTIAIVNQKGGCGKTITAINLSAFLAREGRRVLIVDMDPQGHSTLGLSKDDPSRIQKTVYDVLVREPEGISLRSIIVPVRENLDLVPADILLSGLPEKLTGVAGKENRLSIELEAVRRNYDYIIVDCPPGVGLLTFNALKACSEVIIPVEPSFFSLHGIGKQLETLDLLARETGHEIHARALITLYTGRTEFVKAVADEIRNHLGSRCFATFIRFSGKLTEAAAHAMPVAEFSTRSAGFADYRMLAREVLDQEAAMRMESMDAMEDGADVSIPDISSAGAQDVDVLVQQSLEASRPVVTSAGVLFTIDAPHAQCVQLAGDFNGWNRNGNEMESSGRIWKKLVPLPPGRYHYRYVVDGGWMTDPLNAELEAMPSGVCDSVVVVDGNIFPQSAGETYGIDQGRRARKAHS
jgi:chromosome partitioning protein